MLVVAVGAYLYLNLDNETRRATQTALNKACHPFVAQVGGARFVPGQGITVHDVRLYDPDSPDISECVCQVEMVSVEGNFDVATLVQGQVQVNRVVVDSPQLMLVRNRSGRWNLQNIALQEGTAGPRPTIELRNATLMLADESLAHIEPITVHSVQATLAPSTEPGSTAMTVTATGKSELAERVAISGVFDPQSKLFDIECEVVGVRVEKHLLSMLPIKQEQRTAITQLRGLASVRARVGKRTADQPIDWKATFALNQGLVQHRLLPGALSNIQLEGECKPSGLSLTKATAQWGGTKLRIGMNRTGWAPNAPIALRGQVEQLNTKELPLAQAPLSLQKFWNRFKPDGIAKVNIEADFDGATWHPRATVTFDRGSFEDAEKFRYRLANGHGRIDLNGGVGRPNASVDQGNEPRVDVDITADAEGTPVRIRAAFHSLQLGPMPPGQRRPMPLGWIEVSGNGVPVTQSLVDALPEPSVKRFLYSLRPAGRIDLRWRADRNDPAIHDPKTSLDVRVIDWNVNYDQFAYPLTQVNGWIRQRGKRWTFQELSGIGSGTGNTIRATGELAPEAGVNRLLIRFDGSELPLDQPLWNALPRDVQSTWEFLQPRGKVAFTAVVTSRFGKGIPNEPPEVELSIRPEGRVAVAPELSEEGHRYPLDNLRGTYEWRDDRLTIYAARANHGPTQYAVSDGAWQESNGGGWQLVFNDLHVQRMAFDQDFLNASPSALAETIETLQPTGSIDLYDSSIKVASDGQQPANYSTQWRLGLQCHQTDLTPGTKFEGISGRILLVGSSDNNRTYSTGELALDSVFWNELQLTQVRGPLWTSDQECLIGEGVARKDPTQPPRKLTAKAYDGTVEINSHIKHDGRESYGISAQLSQVNVSRLATEWMQRPEAISGLLDGRLEFEGTGTSIYGLTGRGAVTIQNADLYELPIFVSLLKVLRNQRPDRTAFDKCEAQFTQQGDQLQFQQLDLLGHAISLYGRGAANLNKEVDLTFGALVGRNELAVPMFKAMLSSASEQLLRVRVTGSLDAPNVVRETLPFVGNVLEQFGPAASRPRPAARQPYN